MALPVNPSVRLLTTTLSQVAAALRSAHDPWWVIGSAAVWLHGVGTAVSDHLGPIEHPPRPEQLSDGIVERGGARQVAGSETSDGQHGEFS